MRPSVGSPSFGCLGSKKRSWYCSVVMGADCCRCYLAIGSSDQYYFWSSSSTGLYSIRLARLQWAPCCSLWYSHSTGKQVSLHIVIGPLRLFGQGHLMTLLWLCSNREVCDRHSSTPNIYGWRQGGYFYSACLRFASCASSRQWLSDYCSRRWPDHCFLLFCTMAIKSSARFW